MYIVRTILVIFSLWHQGSSIDPSEQGVNPAANLPHEAAPIKPVGKKPPVEGGNLISNSVECSEDVKRICPKSSLDSNFHILTCLAERPDDKELSAECHTFIWEYKVKMSEDSKFDPMLQSVCAKDLDDIEKLGACGPQSGQPIVSCLVMHKDELEDPKCQRFVEKLSVIVFSDYRLLQGYFKLCKDDVAQQQCGSVDENEQAAHSQGSVIACLEAKYDKVSSGCKVQITKLAELQANDFHLDRALYFACKTDREVICPHVTTGEGKVFQCLMENKRSPNMSPMCERALTARQHLMMQDIKINYGVREYCRDDLERLGDCEYKDDDNQHSQMARMLLCLEFKQRSGNPLTSKCVAQMKSVRKMLMSDYELNPSIVANCGTEISESCNGLQKEGKTLHCLMSMGKDGKLKDNEGCFKSIEFLIRAVNPLADASTDTVLMEACGNVIRRACKDPETGALDSDLIGCLMDKADSKVMTETCSDVLLEISYFASRDWGLDRKLYMKCKFDAEEKCHAKHFGNNLKDESPNGEVFACLYRHINHENKQTRLSNQCTAEVLRVMRNRAISVGLNPHLETLCRAELALHCSDEEKTGKRGEELQCLQDLYQVDTVQANAQLSKQCSDAVRNYTSVETEEVQINRKLFHSCQPMITKYCNEEQEAEVNHGGLFKCMVANKNQADVNEICQAGIEHMQIIQLKDFAFDSEFKAKCRQDVIDVCKESKTKDQVVNCLSLKIRDAKVLETSSPVSQGCQDVLKRALQERNEDVQLDRTFFESCREDMKEFCADVKTGQGRMLECLKDHKEELSGTCHKHVFQREQEEFEDRSSQTDFKLLRRCKAMIMQYCEDEEDVFRCLKRHRKQPDFDTACKNVIEKRMVVQGEDVRFNPALYKICVHDIKQLCTEELKAYPGELGSKPEEFKGAILSCLRKNFVAGKLSDKCSGEIRSFMHQSAQQYKMDFKLKEACAHVVEQHCSDVTDSRVEECLKEKFMDGAIKDTDDNTLKCKKQIGRLLAEGHSDIQADPILQKTCARDLLTVCPGVSPGKGRQIGCLVDKYKEEPKRLTLECRKMIAERLTMWQSASAYVGELESFEDLMQKIGQSSSRHYFLMIFAMIIAVIFIGGLMFGRVTKVHRDVKNR